ncbi:MAG: hypothetical protein A2V65_12190, partial [Deltaproteobacteria bacterium RBG_13_49_15]
QLRELGASAIGIDILFSEPDRTSLSHVIEEMARDLNLFIQPPVIPTEYLDNDRTLSSVLQKGPFVLGFGFSFEKEISTKNCAPKPQKVILFYEAGSLDDETFLFKGNSLICNIPLLSQAAAGEGFFNIQPDPDGILRRAPLLMEYSGGIYPSLALAAIISAQSPGHMILKITPHGVESLTIDGKRIPLDEQGNFLIRFRSPSGSFDHISAADVMTGKILPEKVKNHIVFLGTSAAGLKDIHATPFDPASPGVEVHANIVDNILAGDFIVRPRWASGTEVMLLIVLGLIASVILTWATALVSLGFLLASAAALWIGAVWSLESKGIFLSPLYPFLALAADFSVLSLLKFRIEEKKVWAKAKELNLVRQVTIETVANVAETRDPETGGHIKRTQHYVKALAEHLKKKAEYRKTLGNDEIDLLYQSAPLHDLGKVGVPDYVLLKPGRLTDEEFTVMKRHTTYANTIISAAEQRLGKSSFLRAAREMAYTHQEKWDGSGYPQGLKGEEIPLAGRLMAIADVYDALINRRPYKEPLSHETAVDIINKGSGNHFDPKLVDAFLQISDEFKKIAARFVDEDKPSAAKN